MVFFRLSGIFTCSVFLSFGFAATSSENTFKTLPDVVKALQPDIYNLANTISSNGSSYTTPNGMQPQMTFQGCNSVDRMPQCAPGGEPVDEFSCAEDPDNFPDPATLTQLKQGNNQLLASFQCKKNSFEAIKAELKCLQDQSRALVAQMQSLSSDMLKNMQKMQGDVAVLDDLIGLRQDQMEEVEHRLKGDGLRPGLIKAQEALRKQVSEMPGEIGKVEKGYKDIANQRKQLEENITNRMATVSQECFSTRTYPQYKCDKDGPPQTAGDYLQCRYEQNTYLSDDGKTLRQSGQNRLAKEAKGKKDALASVLAQIAGEVPPNGPAPAGPNGAPPQQSSFSRSILTPEDIDKRYGSTLKGLNSKGIDVYGFVMALNKKCYKEAKRQVETERTLAGSPIYQTQQNILNVEKEVGATVDVMLSKYSSTWGEMMKSLTGVHMPVDVEKCRSGKPDIQMGCFRDLEKNTKAFLAGTGPNSEIQMNIPGRTIQVTPGNFKPTAINFKCQGVDGCVTMLSTIGTNLSTEKKNVEAQKKQYVAKANQYVDQYLQTMANAFSPQAQLLEDRINKINQTLAGLGVDKLIEVDPKKGEELTPNEKMGGLYNVPKDVIAALSGKMNPPMLDFNNKSLGTGLQGLAKGITDVDKEIGSVGVANNKLDTLFKECVAKTKKAERDDDRKNRFNNDSNSSSGSSSEAATYSGGSDPEIQNLRCNGRKICSKTTESELKEDIKSVMEEAGYDFVRGDVTTDSEGETCITIDISVPGELDDSSMNCNSLTKKINKTINPNGSGSSSKSGGGSSAGKGE